MTQISCAITAQPISAFVFATRIVQPLFYLNPKIQASSHLLYVYSLVCVRPGRKPRRPVFSQQGSYKNKDQILQHIFETCHEKTVLEVCKQQRCAFTQADQHPTNLLLRYIRSIIAILKLKDTSKLLKPFV